LAAALIVALPVFASALREEIGGREFQIAAEHGHVGLEQSAAARWRVGRPGRDFFSVADFVADVLFPFVAGQGLVIESLPDTRIAYQDAVYGSRAPAAEFLVVIVVAYRVGMSEDR